MNKAGTYEGPRDVPAVVESIRANERCRERLDQELIDAIRRAHSDGQTYKQIAKQVGVDTATCWRIANLTTKKEV